MACILSGWQLLDRHWHFDGFAAYSPLLGQDPVDEERVSSRVLKEQVLGEEARLDSVHMMSRS